MRLKSLLEKIALEKQELERQLIMSQLEKGRLKEMEAELLIKDQTITTLKENLERGSQAQTQYYATLKNHCEKIN